MDHNLESLISIGEACERSNVLKPSDTLWCTSTHKITVQSLLDLKRCRASANNEQSEHSLQQLKAEIAASIDEYMDITKNGSPLIGLDNLIERMRKLSAV